MKDVGDVLRACSPMHLPAHWGTNAGGPTRTPFPLNLQQENSPHNLSVMWTSTLSSQKRRSNVKTIPAPRCISEEVGRGQICAWMIFNTTLKPPSRSMIIWHEWGELAKSKPSQIWSWLFSLPAFNNTQRSVPSDSRAWGWWIHFLWTG